ncbi:MAG: hypothetical protein EOL93_04175 [Epsilonproteobacteria bacterium]|nr:hypothetical protein [Campylobacterota bacterium]
MKIQKKVKLALIAVILLLFSGCAEKGPMQTKYGLMNTNWHDKIFLESIKKLDEKVLYKGKTVMFKKEKPSMALLQDELVITNKSLYLAEWDTKNLIYNIKLELSLNSIKSTDLIVEERSLFPNSQYLNIVTNENTKYNFTIYTKDGEYLKRIITNYSKNKPNI